MKKFFLVIALCGANVDVASASLDTTKIDQITGLKGKMNEKEGVYKVTLPRDDVKVVVDGWTMPPFMGLGTWAAFTETKNGAMVMGDTVLFEDEVNAAMSAALDNGLSVTALHNHFLFDQPRVFFMHIGGMGTTEQLASAVAKTLAAAKAAAGHADGFGGPQTPASNTIDPKPLEAVFGQPGQAKDGMVKF